MSVDFTFAGTPLYSPPKRAVVNFTWATLQAEFKFPGSPYVPHPGNEVRFSWQAGPHPIGFVATVWGGNIVMYDSLRVFPPGFKAGLFGSVTALQQRFVTVAGAVQTQFGTSNVYNTKQTAQAAGFKASLFGLGSIYNLKRFLNASGALHTLFGTQLVEHTDIRPDGIKLLTRWGTARPYNKTTWLLPLGKDHSVFGTGLHVDNHKFSIDGLVHTKWGLPLIKNFRQIITPIPAVQTKFGTQWVSNKVRRVFAYHPVTTFIGPTNAWITGVPPIALFGTPRATHDRITPAGKVQTKFGTTWISGPQYVRPMGIYDKLFSNNALVESTIRSPLPVGFVATVFGSFASKPQFIHAHGESMTVFPHVWPYYPRVGGTKVTGVGLGNTGRIGTPFISFTPRYIAVPSITMHTKFGVPPYGVMHTFVQHIRPPLMLTEKWGREAWDYRQGMRVVLMERDAMQGFDASSFGSPQAVDGERWRWENTRLSKIGFRL